MTRHLGYNPIALRGALSGQFHNITPCRNAIREGVFKEPVGDVIQHTFLMAFQLVLDRRRDEVTDFVTEMSLQYVLNTSVGILHRVVVAWPVLLDFGSPPTI